MVAIYVWRNKNKKIIGFCAKGHAGWGTHGSDIACAGISALLLTTILGLTDVIKVKPARFYTENGILEFLLPDDITAPKEHDAEILLNTLLAGLHAIQNEYRGSIRIYEKLKGGKDCGRSRGH